MKNTIIIFGLLAIFLASAVSADAPTVTLLTLTDHSYTNDTTPTITFNATGNLSNYTCMLWANSSGTPTPYGNATVTMNGTSSFTFNTTMSDEYLLEWWVNCSGIVVTNSTLSAIHELTIDSTAPVITMNHPASAAHWNSTTNFFWNATVVDATSPYVNCTLYINGALNATNLTMDNGSILYRNVSGTLLPEGNHTYNITCTDNVTKNVGTSGERVLYIDRTFPTGIAITHPTAGATVSSTTFDVSFTAIDNMAPTMLCNVTLGDRYKIYSVNTLGNNTATNTTLSDIQEGTWKIDIRCIDNVSKTVNSSTVVFTIKTESTGLPTQVCSGPNGALRWNPHLNSNLGGCCNVNEVYNAAYALPEYNWGCMPVAGTPTTPSVVIPGTSTQLPDVIPEDMDPVLLVLGGLMAILVAAYMLTSTDED